MHRNIFVLFAPGTGGNHISNLLSTAKGFEPRATVADYESHADRNAHVSGIKNLDPQDIAKIDAGKNNVLCGHWGEYYWLSLNGDLSRFTDRQLVLVSLPKINTPAYQRYASRAPRCQYLVEEQRSLYTPLIYERLFQDKDWFEIDPDWIFTDSLDVFFDFVHTEMALSIDVSVCRRMHQLWLAKIDCE